MMSFSAKSLSRLKLYLIKRKFNFLSWICHLFHLVKRELYISFVASPLMKHAFFASLDEINGSDSFTILGLWVLGLATSNINKFPLQTNESSTLFLMRSLPYYCIPGLARTRWNKNLCAKDAGCAGNKITETAHSLQKFEYPLCTNQTVLHLVRITFMPN